MTTVEGAYEADEVTALAADINRSPIDLVYRWVVQRGAAIISDSVTLES